MVHDQNEGLDVTVSLVKAWPSKEARADLAQRLAALGYPRDAVAAWLSARPFSVVEDHVEVIRDWSSLFDPDTAQEWYDAGFAALDANEWAATGYSPEQAEEVQTLLLAGCTHGTDIA